MLTERLARGVVVIVIVAGVAALASGVLGLFLSPDLPAAQPDTCTDEPCFGFDLGGVSPWALLPFLAHLVLLGAALFLGGLALLAGVVASARRSGRLSRPRPLLIGVFALAAPVAVLVVGEVLPHLVNPCVLSDLAGAEPPAFCEQTDSGADVPTTWHALDHAMVGFLPAALVVGWVWRRRVSPAP